MWLNKYPNPTFNHFAWAYQPPFSRVLYLLRSKLYDLVSTPTKKYKHLVTVFNVDKLHNDIPAAVSISRTIKGHEISSNHPPYTVNKSEQSEQRPSIATSQYAMAQQTESKAKNTLPQKHAPYRAPKFLQCYTECKLPSQSLNNDIRATKLWTEVINFVLGNLPQTNPKLSHCPLNTIRGLLKWPRRYASNASTTLAPRSVHQIKSEPKKNETGPSILCGLGMKMRMGTMPMRTKPSTARETQGGPDS